MNLRQAIASNSSTLGVFVLLGRADRVVKIGERRLDLTRMERLLRAQVGVDEVALTTLQRDSDDPDRDSIEAQERVAAIVVPSEKGWAMIRESGRRAFRNGLRSGPRRCLGSRAASALLALRSRAARESAGETDTGSVACAFSGSGLGRSDGRSP